MEGNGTKEPDTSDKQVLQFGQCQELGNVGESKGYIWKDKLKIISE